MDEMIRKLAKQWRSCGVNEGDILLVHSSLRRTLEESDTNPETVMNSFIAAVGDSGTVLFPLFSFDFPKGVAFDIRKSPSQMGSLTEAARLYPGAVRTGHPIYSFAVIGAQAKAFEGIDNQSGYGPDSPFAKLRELGGKIGVLDLDDLNSMTFYHHIEEMQEVPYRHYKEFAGSYTDAAGNQETRTYKLFVRDLEANVLTDVNPMSELLWEEGYYSGYRPKEGPGLRVIDANKMFERVTKVIKEGKAEGLLYSIGERVS